MKINFKHILFLLVSATLIGVVFFLNKLEIFKLMSPEALRDTIQSYEILAPLIYILLFTFVPLTLFPDSVLAITGGMCFGLLGGFVYTMIGALLGGSLAFFLSKFLGRKLLETFIKPDANHIGKLIDQRGFYIILALRLIPLFPFDVISYGAGLSKISYKTYILATLIGIIPGVLVFTNIGAQMTQIGSTNFYLSISLLILLILGSNMFKKKLQLTTK